MKLLIVSDTHRKEENLYRVFRKEKDFQAMIHLGDAEGREEEITRELWKTHPLCAAKYLRGNCDDHLDLPLFDVVEYGHVKFFLTHGHRYQVNRDPEFTVLAETAYENGCAYALFGHLHVPILMTAVYGVTVLNPGSVSEPRTEDRRATYCVAEIDGDGRVTFTLKYLED